MRVAIVGCGYVGLVAGVCFSESGNQVICVDNDQNKVDNLSNGRATIYEPGLVDLLLRNLREKRLAFSSDIKAAVENSDVIFIAVGTPPGEDGSADLTHVLQVANDIGRYLNGYKVIVNKSTVPVGTALKVEEVLSKKTTHKFAVVSNPEFLKEGAAIDDFMRPDRVVIGSNSPEAIKIVADLYKPFVRTTNAILCMDAVSAEITKYAANAMLAIRISFMNEIANLCDAVGADIEKVRSAIGADRRIGPSFLFPGVGYGGSCFPKDVRALIQSAEQLSLDMLLPKAAESVNEKQKFVIINKILKHYQKAGCIKGKRFAVWGLSFKPKTDDVRFAPALCIIPALLDLGAHIVAFDPEGMANFRSVLGEHSCLQYADSSVAALINADALIICTEWGEFQRPDFELIAASLKDRVIFDGRNIFEPEKISALGITYYGIGRRGKIAD